MRPEVDEVRHATIELANAIRADEGDEAALVGGILVVWEEVEFDHGRTLHSLRYSMVGDNGSPVLALGLLDGAAHLIRRDGLWDGSDDDADDDR